MFHSKERHRLSTRNVQRWWIARVVPCEGGTMASIWKGALAFGLVNIPVELRSAVRSAEKLSFRQLDKKHQQPIKYERVSSVDGKPVPWGEIVKGYEISKGKFVVMDDADFAAAAVEMSRVLEMTDFVPADSIDTRYL